MWLLTFLCAFVGAIADASADSGDELTVFSKCCPKNLSLVKFVDSDTISKERFECMNGESAWNNYNISYFTELIVADSVAVRDEMPNEFCENLGVIQLTNAEVDISSKNNLCYDRLVAEIINGTLVKNIPITVALRCIRNETDNTKSRLRIDRIRRCCKTGQAYDSKYHTCRDISYYHTTDEGTEEEWLIKRLNINHSYVYEVENGLTCKNVESAVELGEKDFTFDVEEGSSLNIIGEKGLNKALQGEWCVERVYNGPGIIVRACTENCSAYDAYCLRKCCPIGEHYKPFRCGSLQSKCVPNNPETVLFNVSHYTDPLKNNYGYDLIDIMGIRVGLICPKGKYALNDSLKTDYHHLTADGRLIAPAQNSDAYCIETFDVSDCDDHQDVVVTALACYISGVEKNYIMAATANSISAVCLAMTLIVYCVLSELRNLHGRTLICHVTTMLLAYSCLARVQFYKVEDTRLCTTLGYGIYFGFVGAFFWLNVMCFDIWWTFGSVRTVQPLRKASSERRRFVWYSAYAWGATLLLTTIVFLLDRYPVSKYLDADMGKLMCWFGSVQNAKSDWPHYIFFVMPMGVVTGINLILWMLTARNCARVKSELHRLQSGSVGDRAKKRFRIDRAKYVLTGKLWVVMGAGWFSELFSTLTRDPEWFWSVVDLINELQGLFIFLILVFKPKVFHLIKRSLGLVKPDAQKNTSSSARTSSTILSRTISSDERANLRTSLPNNDQKRS